MLKTPIKHAKKSTVNPQTPSDELRGFYNSLTILVFVFFFLHVLSATGYYYNGSEARVYSQHMTAEHENIVVILLISYSEN